MIGGTVETAASSEARFAPRSYATIIREQSTSEVKVLVPPIACRPEHKRVWASLAQSPEKVITAMFDEAAHRDPTSQIRWVALRKALAARMPLIPIE